MENKPWTIEGELTLLADRPGIEQALKTLRLLPDSSSQFHVDVTKDWYRAGAETYQLEFVVTDLAEFQTKYLLKACVAFSPAHQLEELLTMWISRRAALSSAGVLVPALFASGRGVIIEEYIPSSLADLLLAQPQSISRFLRPLAAYAGTLAGLGFAPIEAFADLRTRGTDVVAIDFGEDLGEPGLVGEDDRILSRLVSFVGTLGFQLTTEQQAEMASMFYATRTHVGEGSIGGLSVSH